MKRNVLTAAILVFGVALAGCTPSLADRSYDVARDGAQKALSLTFTVAAAVTNWLPESPESKCRHCPCPLPQRPHDADDTSGAPSDAAI
ncbi:MAG TPA: hypothetical protein VLV54_02230 [Thermoanaerobaculia bacterium]|nr:hypothetical protein [Thermoanaerobaculia bacterium]